MSNQKTTTHKEICLKTLYYLVRAPIDGYVNSELVKAIYGTGGKNNGRAFEGILYTLSQYPIWQDDGRIGMFRKKHYLALPLAEVQRMDV